MFRLRRSYPQENAAPRIYSYWKALFLSFYSPKLYVDVVQRWKGCGILYLLFLSFVLGLLWSAKSIWDMEYTFEHFIKPNMRQVPNLMVQNGQIAIPPHIPFPNSDVFRLDANGKLVVLVDPAGKASEAERTEALVLMTSNLIRVHSDSGSGLMVPSMIQLPSDTNGEIGQKQLMDLVDRAHDNLLYLVYPFSVSVLFWTMLMSLFMFSFLGKMIAKVSFHYIISFKQSFRLVCVAASPVSIVFFLFYLLGWVNQYIGIPLLAFLSLYYFFGIRSNKLK